MAWRHLRTPPGFKVVKSTPHYATEFTQAQVCLAALGQGWGIRAIWAMAAGCVPLLPASPTAYFFGNGGVNYSRFALPNVPASELDAALPRRLDNARDAGLLDALQQSLLVHRRLFLWPPAGLAYHMTLRELCRRSSGRPQGAAAAHGWARPACDRLLPEAEHFSALL